MPASKCPACSHTGLESQPAKFAGGDHSYLSIQCSKCGAVVGVVPDVYHLMEKLSGIESEVLKLALKVK